MAMFDLIITKSWRDILRRGWAIKEKWPRRLYDDRFDPFQYHPAVIASWKENESGGSSRLASLPMLSLLWKDVRYKFQSRFILGIICESARFWFIVVSFSLAGRHDAYTGRIANNTERIIREVIMLMVLRMTRSTLIGISKWERFHFEVSSLWPKAKVITIFDYEQHIYCYESRS